MQLSRFFFSLLLLVLTLSATVEGQEKKSLSFFEIPDTLHPGRFWTSASVGAVTYTGTMIGLNNLWYSEYEKTSFQLFNDWNEWHNLDKMGHAFTTYFEANWMFQTARWTGMKRRKALWLSVGLATLFQTSVEMLDGFSEKWGFSVYDIGANTLGAGLLVSQELAWGEQRILMKASNSYPSYPNDPVFSLDGNHESSTQRRAEDLFGGSIPGRFLKDYNGQTIWVSANIHSFLPNKADSKFPKWLNLAVGYGANNMYGGFSNTWQEDGQEFSLDPFQYPRYQQFYLSPDIDLRRIKTKSPLLRTLLGLANVIKIPAPALEFNTQGKVIFHPIHF